MKATTAICVLLVAACAPAIRQYAKPGATPEDLRTDRAACMALARAATPEMSMFAESRERDITHLCLEGKGWRVQEQPQAR
jgi:hypothetical protein